MLCDRLTEMSCLLGFVEGPVKQPSEGPAVQPGPSHLPAETEPVSQQPQLSA